VAGTAQHNASPDRGRTTHLIGYPHPARISPINNRAPTGWMYGRRAPDSWSGAWKSGYPVRVTAARMDGRPGMAVIDRVHQHADSAVYVGLPQDGRGGSGYPVASASLSRSGPGAGVQVEHRMR
jgi:hypothetical protein